MAALNGTQNFYERPYEVISNSTLPLFNLLEHYAKSAIKPMIIYAGSSESYAGAVNRLDWMVPTDETVPLVIDDPLNPRWSYGGSKLFGEILTVNGCNSFDMKFIILRYHNIFGPRMGVKHVIPDFLMRAKEGIYVLNGYEDTRSFLYIDDAVLATIGAVECGSLNNQIVNVGSQYEISIKDLGLLIMRTCKLTGKITLNPSPKGSVKRRCPDITKLIKNTNWYPKISLEEGISSTAKYYLT